MAKGYHRKKKESLHIAGRLETEEEKLLFGKVIQQGWKLMPKPEKGSWLDRVNEKGQNLKQFTSSSFRNKLDSQRNILHISQIDWIYLRTQLESQKIINNLELRRLDVMMEMMPSLSELSETVHKFTRMETCILAPIFVDLNDIHYRIKDGRIQFLTTDLQDILKKNIPLNSYTIIGMTNIDLYANDKNNGLIGEATLDERVALISIHRYHPKFKMEISQESTENDIIEQFKLNEEKLEKIRLYTHTVVLHECLHTMGMRHCIHFKCIMNGGHPHPQTLCPLCLRKLHVHLSFTYENHIQRYSDLIEHWSTFSIPENQILEFLTKRHIFLSKNLSLCKKYE